MTPFALSGRRTFYHHSEFDHLIAKSEGLTPSAHPSQHLPYYLPPFGSFAGTVLGLLVTFDGFILPAVDTSTVSVAGTAEAVSVVFNDFPSGLRVESGDFP